MPPTRARKPRSVKLPEEQKQQIVVENTEQTGDSVADVGVVEVEIVPIQEAPAHIVEAEDQLASNVQKLSKFQKNHTLLMDKLQDLESIIDKEANSRPTRFVLSLQKKLGPIQNQALKLAKKKPAEDGPDAAPSRVRSGLQKEVTVSRALAEFANWDPEKKYSRVEATKRVCEYIKDHNLRSSSDGRIIVPDDKLKALLQYNPEKDSDLTYARLQTYLAKHFPKEIESVV